MGLDGAPGHLQAPGDFIVFASLEQQFDDLLFPRTEQNRALDHPHVPPRLFFLASLAGCRRVASRTSLSKLHSIRNAIVRLDFP